MPRSDHIIPLALGGHPRSLDNLQIQPWPEAKRKDRIEVKLQCLVCSGQITLPDAQTLTARDWESAYNTYASVPCHRHRQLPASVVAYQGAPSHADRGASPSHFHVVFRARIWWPFHSGSG